MLIRLNRQQWHYVDTLHPQSAHIRTLCGKTYNITLCETADSMEDNEGICGRCLYSKEKDSGRTQEDGL